MHTGRLSISRGHKLGEASPPPRLAVVAEAPAQPAAALPLYPEFDERLTALERLARLFEQGALSPQEFAGEKALVLGRFVAQSADAATPVSLVPAERRRPSLLGRLLSWKLLPLGIAAGLAFSFASQPADTIAFFDDLLSLAGL